MNAMKHVCGAVVSALLLTPFVDPLSGIDHSPIRSDAKVVAEILREQRDVVVDGAREQWRLVWKGKPQPACAPDDGLEDGWLTCPCDGFAFGEQGDLDLVRLAGTSPEDRLSLTPLFDPDWVPLGGRRSSRGGRFSRRITQFSARKRRRRRPRESVSAPMSES